MVSRLFPSLRETFPAATNPVVCELPEVMVKPAFAIAFHSTAGGGGGGGGGFAASAALGASGLAKVNVGLVWARAGSANSSAAADETRGGVGFMAGGL